MMKYLIANGLAIGLFRNPQHKACNRNGNVNGCGAARARISVWTYIARFFPNKTEKNKEIAFDVKDMNSTEWSFLSMSSFRDETSEIY
jgi:hypothetical protein